MFCPKCGEKIQDESLFCYKCGNKLETNTKVKTIKLQCKNCNGTMEVDPELQEITCPYCGEKEKILDSDAVAIEKIRSKAYKETEFAKISYEKEKQIQQERKEDQNKYRKSKLSKITLILVFICIILTVTAFKAHHIMAAFIALAQTGLFAVSWLMGMQIIKEKRRFLHVLLAVVGVTLMLPFFKFNQESEREKRHILEWPESGLAAYLPAPQTIYGKIYSNSDDSFSVELESYDQKGYENYLNACLEMGYTVEGEKGSSSYEAYNADGYKLRLSYYDYRKYVSIHLDAPRKMAEFKWPSGELGVLLPKPKSSIGNVNWERYDGFIIYVGNTPLSDYNAYVDAVSQAGFIVSYYKSDKTYSAENEDGYSVRITYEGYNTMRIQLDAPKQSTNKNEEVNLNADTETNGGDLAANIEADTDQSIMAENVDKDLKAFLDSYEAFIDKYVKFMKRYNESDNPALLLIDYTSLMTEYVTFTEKLSEYDMDTMTEVDLLYYTEVITRCSEKMSKSM